SMSPINTIKEKKTSLKTAALTAVLMTQYILSTFSGNAQAVTEIITDYNGYWKSATTAMSPIRPDNDHNLLAFSYGGMRFSTGVNDALLTANGESFAAGDFRALQLSNFSGTLNSNTKIGLGAMKDGVFNGRSATPPSRSIAQYLNDGAQGLNLGTGIANLPVGTLNFSIGAINDSLLGDNIPDMLITQIADPSGVYDRYEFTDVNGVRIGNYVDVNLNGIASVGRWVADFYEATGATILSAGYTQTERFLRLWTADFSAFGINASNVAQVAYFRITLNGNSDIAFVAYNTKTITLNSTLSLPAAAPRVARTTTPEASTKSVKLFPNPATASITISHDVARQNEHISIYNMQGVLVSGSPVVKGSTQSRINISGLRPGNFQVVYTNGTDRSAQLLVVR
ncbi:MAG TPA: T9SS type A sorting domain-containing protein, partial [Flavitalea sp.]|nr:T9SS type A sorting domain-containing protein [Flavitalea sp.]